MKIIGWTDWDNPNYKQVNDRLNKPDTTLIKEALRLSIE